PPGPKPLARRRSPGAEGTDPTAQVGRGASPIPGSYAMPWADGFPTTRTATSTKRPGPDPSTASAVTA
ncbi:hypothetical protein AB0L81_18125, partial [Streptomyces sp. NPDC052127]